MHASPMPASLHADINLQIDTIEPDAFSAHDLPLHVARLDLVDSQISGNKWFKLRLNLEAAEQANIRRIVSFGGAWSNHLHALAAAGQRFGFETVGIVRGEAAHGLTPTLSDAQRWGMQIRFVDRAEYRRRKEPDYLESIAKEYAPCVIVPEGGSNELGIAGCEAIGHLLAQHDLRVNPSSRAHHVVLATATGSTLAGIARVLGTHFHVHAVLVLHARESVQLMLEDQAGKRVCDVQLQSGFEHGGYANTTPQLLEFMNDFERRHGMALDHVYTAKALHALHDLHSREMFGHAGCITFLHTGGLQGRRGLQQPAHKKTQPHLADAMTGWE